MLTHIAVSSTNTDYRHRQCSTTAPILRSLSHDVYVCGYVSTIKRKTPMQSTETWQTCSRAHCAESLLILGSQGQGSELGLG